MRKRKRTRQNVDPKTQLIKLGKNWWTACVNKEFDKALEFREKAETIFKEHPNFRDKAPSDAGRNLFIDWIWFVKFDKPDWRAGYIEAVEKNQWPPRPKKQ